MKPRFTRAVVGTLCLGGGLLCCSCESKPIAPKAPSEKAPLVAVDPPSAAVREDARQRVSPDPVPVAARPFDRLHDAYFPFLDPDDPLAFPMKVRSLAQSPLGMWRGGKDLFYLWCKTNAGEWINDRESFVTQEGDQHLGNVGTYLVPGDKFGSISFGMVDYDETARLPFQYELLQGLITLELSASTAGIELSEKDIDRLASVMLEEYKSAIGSTRTAAEILRGDAWVKKLFAARDKVDYGKALRAFLSDDRHFVSARVTKKGEVKDILRPADDRADAMAKGIADALARDSQAAKLFRVTDAASIREKIRAVALRTRLGSAGSQGLRKYFVLLNEPIVGLDMDIILYVKQQIPSAAERNGLIPADARPPAQRAADDSRLLNHPPPLLSGWCEIGKESYWVAFREPWTKELDADELKNIDDLFQAARIWAVAAGASHREPGEQKAVADRITPELAEQLKKLSNVYLRQVQADYTDFVSDVRVKELLVTAEDAIKAATTNAAFDD